MGSAAVTTVFQPDPTCFAPSNLWLWEGRCRQISGAPNTAPCTYAYHGHPQGRVNGWYRRDADPCYPDVQLGAQPTYYTDCPESFTAAATWRGEYNVRSSAIDMDEGVAITTICCPDAYPYFYHKDSAWPPLTSTSGDGQTAEVELLRRPSCVAASVEVLRSEIVTVTLATEPDVETTTTAWAEDAVLYADAFTVTATEYGGYPAVSTCWGAGCPATFTASFPDPPVATPMTAQFTPPPECTDAANIWSVTTSCYITSPQNHNVYTPNWLECAVTQMGGNEFMATSCAPSALSNDQGSYYAGCPAGYTAARTATTEAFAPHHYTVGYYDAIVHEVHCCPDSFDFQAKSEYGFGQDIATSHDGRWYGVFRYPLPGCYATSVSALSGKDVPMHTHSAAFGWDKRQEQPDFPVTQAWDYTRGTLFAPSISVISTVFMGTHTCYESCSTWFSYYYPDATGGASPTRTPTPTPTPTPDAGSSERETQGPSTDGAGSEASPTPSNGTGPGSADEASSGPSSTAPTVPESGARSLVRAATVGAPGMVALVALWLAF